MIDLKYKKYTDKDYLVDEIYDFIDLFENPIYGFYYFN